jgi:hypothetical protein
MGRMTKIVAETATYKVTVETVKSSVTLIGSDDVYAIVNKETGVVEGRAGNLPDALGYLHNIQNGYEAILANAAGTPNTPAEA